MAYALMKRIIERGNYDKASIMDKLDAFMAVGRITPEEYKELVGMMEEGNDNE